MSGIFDSLDSTIREHLRFIRSAAGLPEGPLSLELLAEGWRDKEEAFSKQVQNLDMEETSECRDGDRGFLALTYSGSLVAVGPVENGCRRAVYVSIDRRRDVPARAESDDAALDGPVTVGAEIRFSRGPVRQSSAVYKLALLQAALPPAEQNEKLDEATLVLTREFKAVDETMIEGI